MNIINHLNAGKGGFAWYRPFKGRTCQPGEHARRRKKMGPDSTQSSEAPAQMSLDCLKRREDAHGNHGNRSSCISLTSDIFLFSNMSEFSHCDETCEVSAACVRLPQLHNPVKMTHNQLPQRKWPPHGAVQESSVAAEGAVHWSSSRVRALRRVCYRSPTAVAVVAPRWAAAHHHSPPARTVINTNVRARGAP